MIAVLGLLLVGCPKGGGGSGSPSGDTTPPTILSVQPDVGATDVVTNTALSVVFSEAMDGTTVTTATFVLNSDSGPVDGTVDQTDTSATFRPSANLAPDTAFTATITTGAQDLAGNPLAADFVWSFTTGAGTDTSAPIVLSTNPLSGAADVAVHTAISATFSELMDPSTLTTATFFVAAGGSAVDGSVGYSGATATFTPSADLAQSSVYTVTITTGAKDLAGNPLAADLTWSFTTEGPDTIPPIVLSTSPASGAAGVALNSAISATFSEPMDPSTFTSATFVVGAGGSAVAGSVSANGNTATFTPSANLPPDTSCTVTITTAVRDLAGNALAADYTWQFTSGGALDMTPPTVTSTTPTDNATSLPIHTAINATFSEVMNASTLTTATFTVSTGGSPTAGSVGYSGVTATFTPAAALAMGATYTATIATGATDLAGNHLAADFAWQFTTLAKPDLCVTLNGVNGCFAKINDALAAANPGNSIGVASGTYIENVAIGKTVVLSGGWNLTFDDLDPANHLTLILPANVAVAIVTATGQFGNTSAVAPTIQGFTISGAVSTNHGGGLRIQNSDAVVRNNTITNNTAYLLGGGVWVQNGAPRFENNQIKNNTVNTTGANGGGIELENTQAILIGNLIDGNKGDTTAGHGGGVAIAGGGPVTLTNNTITNNAAADQAAPATGSPAMLVLSYGGGVYVIDATVTMTGNLIQKNTANSATTANMGGGPYAAGGGGGVYITGSPAFTLTNNTIGASPPIDANNTSVSNTAGFAYNQYLLGGGVLIDSSQGVLSGNVIAKNQANRASLFGNGAGLCVTASTIAIQGGQIIYNKTAINNEGYGGGIYAKSSTITLNGTLVQNNGAGNTPFYGMGGAMCFIDTTYTLTNAIIANNRAFGDDSSNGGIFAGIKTTNPNSANNVPTNNSPGVLVSNTIADNKGQAVNVAAPTTFFNNIITGGTTGIKLTGAGPLKIVYNNFYNNTNNTAAVAPAPAPTLDATNIIINPQLNPSYHLAAGSPAIDAGTHGPVTKAGTTTGETVNIPDTDFDGESRVMIGTSGLFKVDIGADEFTGAAQKIVNLDTTGADLTVIGPGGDPNLAQNAATNDWIGYAVMAGDVNGDGKVDLVTSAEDFAIDMDNPPFTPGRLFGLFNTGARQTGTIDLLATPADLIVDNRLKLQHLGRTLVGGDFNGDSKSDLIAGSCEDDNGGNGTVWPTVFVYYGGSSLAGTRLLDDTHPAEFALRAPGQDFRAFSEKNALTLADLNGNGKADLVVGDSLANDGATATTGAVFVLFGGSTLTGLHDLGATAADYTLYGPAANAKLQACAVGRVSADAQNDLVARTATSAYVIFGPVSAGARHLASAAADITINGLAAGGVVVMDLTGDGQDDLILASADKLYVVPGPLAAGTFSIGAAPGLITLIGVKDALFAIGDVVGDAHPDLIIGSYSIGRTFAIAGGTVLSGTLAAADAAATLVTTATIKELGFDVAAGDFDNDSRPDLIVASYFQNVDSHPDKSKDAGIVYVIYGK